MDDQLGIVHDGCPVFRYGKSQGAGIKTVPGQAVLEGISEAVPQKISFYENGQ